MRVLAVDAGNTRVKWGVWEYGVWLASGAAATANEDAVRDALGDNPPVERIAIANVAGPSVAERIQSMLPKANEVYWAASRAEQCGVRSSYADPAQLGVDRWAALIGARRVYDGPCVVVNAGTTMTVDALSADGIFLGGFIVAGYDLMRDALARGTAQLRPSAGAFTFFPDNTDDAIASGAINALAGAIDRMWAYLADTGEADAAVVLSGGNARLVEPQLSQRVVTVDYLVLEGLVAMVTDRG